MSMTIEKWVKDLKSRSPSMKKIRVDDCICHGKIVDHNRIKDRILTEIERDYCTESSAQFPDRVSKLDWSKSEDLTRPWVKILYFDLFFIISPRILILNSHTHQGHPMHYLECVGLHLFDDHPIQDTNSY